MRKAIMWIGLFSLEKKIYVIKFTVYKISNSVIWFLSVYGFLVVALELNLN